MADQARLKNGYHIVQQGRSPHNDSIFGWHLQDSVQIGAAVFSGPPTATPLNLQASDLHRVLLTYQLQKSSSVTLNPLQPDRGGPFERKLCIQ